MINTPSPPHPPSFTPWEKPDRVTGSSPALPSRPTNWMPASPCPSCDSKECTEPALIRPDRSVPTPLVQFVCVAAYMFHRPWTRGKHHRVIPRPAPRECRCFRNTVFSCCAALLPSRFRRCLRSRTVPPPMRLLSAGSRSSCQSLQPSPLGHCSYSSSGRPSRTVFPCMSSMDRVNSSG